MLGDWVRIMQPKNFHGDERRLQVTEISEVDDSICYLSGDAGGELTISTKHLEPIPLTPEILEKNGLKPDAAEDAYAYRYQIDGVSIVECYVNARGRYRGIFAFGDTRLRITLRFVHELQHALRLCGIEKEVVL